MTPPRPTRNDPEVLAVFYKLFAEEMKKNCAELCSSNSLEEIEGTLALAGRSLMDGYEYAKRLERYIDGIAANDVEVFDGAKNKTQIITGVWLNDVLGYEYNQ